MRFDPILPAMPEAGPIPAVGRAGAPALPGACATLAATALGLTVAASLLVSQGHAGWPVLPLALALFAPVVGFVLWTLGEHPHVRFGPANVVTAVRGGMAAALGACAWDYGRLAEYDAGFEWMLAGAALLALALDGLDGWLARRTGLASRFGARFDMEVDAFLILILCALAFADGKAGAHVFLIGLMRYAFVVWGALDPRLARPLAPSLRRKTVCVLQIALLCFALLPPVDPPLSEGVVLAALVLLAWSFAVDIRALRSVRP
ncbi:CDP-alcohol phosphatidyltransferase family protein [Aureimonas flava]|uniref:CDP-alcohol phosphatidyltransferase family protein n=1 Tax=Aureimonas flava TaxID=2320271 RepID=A0A3A1WPG8_9HYPH|nr:CDP-alcohol phosphatidyltransferase family protein [Aureimonas flava]RIY02016.1 CDP-alcohol phosphatidyltransferase family protein [Aureimonas flava]